MSDLPVGGTTGFSHEHSAAVEEAARYLAGLPRLRHPRPIVPHLRERFGLTPKEACEAIREGNLMLARSE